MIRLAEHGLDATFAAILASLNREVAALTSRAEVMAALRIAKRRAALTIALADLAGQWELMRVTGALSEFAELVARHRCAVYCSQPALPPATSPAEAIDKSGLIVFGMGKLGAYELNYSSDIDLIVLFDAEHARYRGKRDVQALLHECSRKSSCASWPSAPPTVMCSAPTCACAPIPARRRRRSSPRRPSPITKARARTGNAPLSSRRGRSPAIATPASAFLAELRPFLWRKHLDFAAIEDIHSIKRQINAHRGGATIAVAGHDIKLGRGGIREIEFFAQTQQLIWGGRKPELRLPGTLAALRRARGAGTRRRRCARRADRLPTVSCASSSIACR